MKGTMHVCFYASKSWDVAVWRPGGMSLGCGFGCGHMRPSLMLNRLQAVSCGRIIVGCG